MVYELRKDYEHHTYNTINTTYENGSDYNNIRLNWYYYANILLYSYMIYRELKDKFYKNNYFKLFPSCQSIRNTVVKVDNY